MAKLNRESNERKQRNKTRNNITKKIKRNSRVIKFLNFIAFKISIRIFKQIT